jgi:negative regulator of flagellin synthesis FlgM
MGEIMNNVGEMQKTPLFTDPQKNSVKRVGQTFREQIVSEVLTPSQDAKVNISDLVKDFAKIKMAVDNAEEIDNSEKVAILKGQVARGAYQIDYDKLAENILHDEF